MTTTPENVEGPTGRANRSLFVEFATAPGSESELTTEKAPERAYASSEMFERIMQRSVPPERWGINE